MGKPKLKQLARVGSCVKTSRSDAWIIDRQAGRLVRERKIYYSSNTAPDTSLLSTKPFYKDQTNVYLSLD